MSQKTGGFAFSADYILEKVPWQPSPPRLDESGENERVSILSRGWKPTRIKSASSLENIPLEDRMADPHRVIASTSYVLA